MQSVWAYKVIHLFSVVFCVITTVHKFDFGLLVNGTSKNGKLKENQAVTETLVFDRIRLFYLHRRCEC